VSDSRELFSNDELTRFERDGYLIAPGLTDAATVAEMQRVTADGLAQAIEPIEYEADLHYPGAPESRSANGGQTARRLKQALVRGPVFLDWMSRPEVLGRLRQLLGPTVICPLAHHNCIMTKQPAFSSDTGWHQDIRYWSFERPNLVSVWIALGEERLENGGLMVIPGSHRLTYHARQFDDTKFFRADLPENQALIASRVPVVLHPGDVLFFHCLTLHAASRNLTAEPKLSVVFTFRGGDNRPVPGSRSAASPELVLTPGA
jgi:phytanoyl-CoA hydroxylase